MSTYTDFHNKRKETIQVNIDPGCVQDRATNQHVKFLNEQNEYMGTFKGKLALSATEFTNVTLSGVKIVDSELCGDVKIPTAGIDLTAIGGSIAFISSTVSGVISSAIDHEIEARISVDNLLSAAMSSQVSASAKEISGLLSAYTNAQISATKKELSNVLSSYTNEICADLSNTVKNKGFLKPEDFKFSYVGHEIILSARNEIGQPMEFKINSAEFEKGRNLKEVRRIDSSSKGPYVELIFTLEDKTEKSIEVPLSCFEYLYKAGDGISIDDKTLAISANETIARLKFVEDNDSYLSGKIDGNIEDIDVLSASVKQTLNELSDIRIQNIKQLKFIAHANLTWKPRTFDSLSNFFITCNLVGDGRTIKNGAIIDIEKISPKERVEIEDRDEKLALGLGDFLIVHDHNEELDVHVNKLISYGTEQNVFIVRAGISRYEYENFSSLCVDQIIDGSTVNSDRPASTSAVYTYINNISSDLISGLTSQISTISSELNSNLSSQISTISSDLNSRLISQISAVSSDLSSNLTSQISAVSSDLSSSFKSQISTVSADLNSNLISQISRVSSDLSSSFKSQISTISSDLSLNLTSQISTISSELNSSLSSQISTVSTDLNSNLVSQISRVSTDLSSNLTSQISAVSSDLSSSFKSQISTVSADLSSGLTSQISAVSSVLSSNLSSQIFTISSDLNLSLSSQISVVSSDLNSSFKSQISVVSSDLSSDLLSQISTVSTDLNSSFKSQISVVSTDLSSNLTFQISAVSTDLNSSLSSQISTVSSDLNSNLVSQISRVSTDLSSSFKSQISTVSSDLSLGLTSQISAISSELNSNLSSQISVISSDLTDEINEKIWIEDRINGSISDFSDLSIVKISKEEYDLSVAAENSILCSNTLYVVESDFIDAYGQQIKNVDRPTDISDAVPKWYVDDVRNKLSSIAVSLRSDEVLAGKVNYNAQLSTIISAVVLMFSVLSSF